MKDNHENTMKMTREVIFLQRKYLVFTDDSFLQKKHAIRISIVK